MLVGAFYFFFFSSSFPPSFVHCIQAASTEDVHVHTTYSNPYQGGSRLIPFLPLLFPVTSFLHLSCFQISFHPKKLRPASTCHICRGLSVLLFFFPSFSSARRSITNFTTVCNIDRSLPLTSVAATLYQRVISSNLAVLIIYDPIARTGTYFVLSTIEQLTQSDCACYTFIIRYESSTSPPKTTQLFYRNNNTHVVSIIDSPPS